MDPLDQMIDIGLAIDLERMFWRLASAMGLGLLLGIDREVRQKPAGLRSHMLVSLAAATFTIMAFAIVDAASQFGDVVKVDPLRLMEAVVAGIAFLGAGAIIQGRGTVKGITTGASLWMAGALGVACGIGYYRLALVAGILSFLILAVLGWLEHRVTAHLQDDGTR